MGTKEEDVWVSLREEIAESIRSASVTKPPSGNGIVTPFDLADALRPLFRRTAEQAWDEGAEGGFHLGKYGYGDSDDLVNPYRVSVEGNE